MMTICRLVDCFPKHCRNFTILYVLFKKGLTCYYQPIFVLFLLQFDMRAYFKEQILCEGAGYRVSGIAHMGGLYLNLRIQEQNRKLRKFEARLNSLRDQPQLQKWFDSIQELQHHLKQPNNFKIDQPNKKFTILISATKNAIRHVPIGELSLMENDVSECEILEEIVLECKRDGQTTGSQLKKMILTLSQIMIPVLSREKERQREKEKGLSNVVESPFKISQPIRKSEQFGQSTSNIDELKWQYDRKINELEQKIQKINEQIQELNQKFQQQRDGTNIQRRMSSKQKIGKSLVELIDPICKDFDFLKISNSLITVEQGIWGAYIFGKKKIKSRNSFSIKIVKVQKFISIGIGSQQLRTEQIKGSDNHILYDNSKKLHGPGLVLFDQGRSFKSGQTVTVTVHHNSHEITWKVNHQTRLSYKNQKIGDFSIEWVPLIQLPNIGDCIQWID